MFGVKVLGSLLVLLAASGLGTAKSMEYRGRIRSLAEMRRLFLLLDGEIRSSRTPVPDAFLHMSSRMQEEYKGFLLELAEELNRMEGEQFRDLWCRLLEKHFGEGRSFLKKEDLELAASFGDVFGYLDSQMQMDAIRFLQEQLLERMSALSACCGSRMRLARLLGVSLGIFLVLILV